MPIDPVAIRRTLRQAGFQERHETDKMWLFHSPSGQPIYVNRRSQTGRAALRVHPGIEGRLALSQLDGTRCIGERFHSNMTEFPAKEHLGTEPNHYGVAFDFETTSALRDFLSRLP